MAKTKWDFSEISKEILSAVGGLQNINDMYHCATRLRIVVKDPTKVNEDALKGVDGILGVVVKGNEVQNVVGQQVDEYYNGVVAKSGFQKKTSGQNNTAVKEDDAEVLGKKKMTVKRALSATLDFISGVVLPVMPVFVAAGFLMALLNLAKTFFGLDPNSGTAVILSSISSAGFFFLPVYIGFQAADRMKIPGAMGAFLGAILVSTGVNNTGGLSFLGMGIGKTQYNGTVLPVILGVFILAFFYRSLNRFLPKEVTYFFTPLIAIVLTVPLVLLFIGPFSNTVSNGLAAAFAWLSAKANWLAFALYSALNPILVMFGIDKGFIPIVINNMAKMGYDTLIYPAAMTSNPAMGAAAIAVAVQSHKLKTRGEGFSAGVTGVLGITEPSIFGFLLPYRRALFGAMAGGAIGGLVGGLFQVKQGALMSPGAISLVSYFVGPNPTANFTFAVIALITSIIASFVITTILIRTDKEHVNNGLFVVDDETPSEEVIQPSQHNPGSTDPVATETPLMTPVSGELMPLSGVKDKMFAQKTLGDGFGVEPSSDQIVAPADGVISTIFPTKHAIGLTTQTGLEVLIHLGIDTVDLKGVPFTVQVMPGQQVRAGQPLATMDRQRIIAANKGITVMVIVTNMDQVQSLTPVEARSVVAGDVVETVESKSLETRNSSATVMAN